MKISLAEQAAEIDLAIQDATSRYGKSRAADDLYRLERAWAVQRTLTWLAVNRAAVRAAVADPDEKAREQKAEQGVRA